MRRGCPSLAGGKISATTCLWSRARCCASIAPALVACPAADGGWRLSGAADFVGDADLADHLVVSAADAGAEQTLGFVVALPAAGVRIEPLTVDGRLPRVSDPDSMMSR